MDDVLAEAFPAGEFLAEELEERGWTKVEFAEILGRPTQFVSEIIAGKKEITRESAAQIGAALGTSAELWLNLQNAYHLWLHSQNQETQAELDDVRLRARLQELAPVALLCKRGIVTKTSASGQAEELRKLFCLESIYDDPVLSMAARRSNQDERVSPNQLTWLACVRRKAKAVTVSTYSVDALKALSARLSQDVVTPTAFRALPQAFADVGVRLVYVEAFPSSKIDGASFMLDDLDDSPVIGLSGRGKRLDKVLFTILHEAAHVALGHVNGGRLILDDEGQQTLDQEEPADHAAAEWMLPKGLSDLPDRIGRGWVVSMASAQGVHPIVVVGRLQKEGKLHWRSSLAKAAPSVTEHLQAW